MLFSKLSILYGAIAAASVVAQDQGYAPYEPYVADSGAVSDGLFPASLTVTPTSTGPSAFHTVYAGAGYNYERRNYHPHAIAREIVQATTTVTSTVTNTVGTQTVTSTVVPTGAAYTRVVTSTVRSTTTVGGSTVTRTAVVTDTSVKATTKKVTSTATKTITSVSTKTVTAKA